MPISPETEFTPIEDLKEISSPPSLRLPLFGELVEGVPVDINFIQTEDYYDSQVNTPDETCPDA